MTINLLPNLSYPQNQSTNIPIGSNIKLIFNSEVDLQSIKDSLIISGNDFSKIILPDNALWLNNSDGQNKDFLRSPNMQGLLDFDIEVKFLNPLTLEVLEDPFLKEKGSYYSLVIITPVNVFNINSTYNVYVLGSNIQNLDTLLANKNVVSEKTVYDPYLNSIKDNRVKVKGIFRDVRNSNKLSIQIIKSGIGAAAEYVYYFSDQPISLNDRQSKCSQRWRNLERGLLIKFDNVQFNEGEIIEVNCYNPVLLVDSYSIEFTTGDGSMITQPEPDYASTSPINTAIVQVDEPLRIINISPVNGEVNVALDLSKIIIEFNKPLDPTTISQDTISLQILPVSGFFDGGSGTKQRETKLYKIVTVVDNKIILEI